MKRFEPIPVRPSRSERAISVPQGFFGIGQKNSMGIRYLVTTVAPCLAIGLDIRSDDSTFSKTNVAHLDRADLANLAAIHLANIMQPPVQIPRKTNYRKRAYFVNGSDSPCLYEPALAIFRQCGWDCYLNIGGGTAGIATLLMDV